MKKEKSDIPFEYVTIKTTIGRIRKGLLAIPVSLIDLFPQDKREIVVINERGKEEFKPFTPWNSSSRECRIGGLKDFYEKYSIQSGEELVIQILEGNKFKIVPERVFKNNIVNLEKSFELASTEQELNKYLDLLCTETKKTKEEVAKSEFLRTLSNKPTQRKSRLIMGKTKETVPLFIRKILLEIYKGKCQISNFTFLTKAGLPYFEIHHIKPELGHHFKNLLVVSPNVHAQFTYSNTEEYFDNEGWLRKVKFNDDEFFVRQAVDFIAKDYFKEVHY
ncbi:MAG: HNH endonuclease signature motif containing protein [Bacteroidota bacterium]